MSSRVVAAMAAVSVLGFVGCTNVQKGTAAGGGLGSAVGAVWGHATPLGGVPGALIGLGAGGLGGALAADYYYDEEDTKLAAVPDEELARLQNQLETSHQRQEELKGALEREKAQQRALLEAHEKTRNELLSLKDKLGSSTQVSRQADTITLTILSEVLFDSGKATLKAGGKEALGRAAAVIRDQFPDADIEIRGHTDSVPIRYSSYKSNWELSCARALAVVHYLIKTEGFQPARLMATGCGETRPVASNNAPEGRRRNRRAEIVIRPKDLNVAEQKFELP